MLTSASTAIYFFGKRISQNAHIALLKHSKKWNQI